MYLPLTHNQTQGRLYHRLPVFDSSWDEEPMPKFVARLPFGLDDTDELFLNLYDIGMFEMNDTGPDAARPQSPNTPPRDLASQFAHMTPGEQPLFLAELTPEERRRVLGENLYPLVEELEPEKVSKVTGMLLELDNTEILQLIASPEALQAKVAEALEVLRTHQLTINSGGQHDSASTSGNPVS
ncbi:hypothetical protein DH2020_018686 [Rehmannia glutinosa]|uniref:PABC domain-containing protein n=1 Tax=Rehmannia glutinosa TaxID=99300 RepID=A0ABR0WL04_REHGL